jgi:hypothetical protein
VKVRLHGTGEEVAEVTCRRLEVLDVVSVSDPCPDREPACSCTHVYLEVHMGPAGPGQRLRRQLP